MSTSLTTSSCLAGLQSTLLRVAYRATTELETSLEVARSNLKLVQANNDMLEEALKRSDTKDVGWKRWSAREGMRIEEERPKSLDDSARSSGNASTASLPAPPPSTSPALDAGAPATVTVSSPVTPNPPAPSVVSESRFFRGFRFGSSTPTTHDSRSPTRSFTSPLNSPSLPSLVPDKDSAEVARENERAEREKELEELTKALEKEKVERVKATDDKAALEDEIESLSQALFEEVRAYEPVFALLGADDVSRRTKWLCMSASSAPKPRTSCGKHGRRRTRCGAR